MQRAGLIITADDYGMSPLFNQAIEELARAGIITGISVMIQRKYIRAKNLLALSVPLGLHLELEDAVTYTAVVSQIKRFEKRFGQLPTYLDGHQHKHLTPKNLRYVIRAAKRFNLPVRSRLPEDRKALRKAGILTPDNFISWHPGRLPILKERIQAAKKFTLSELVVHPGYYDKNCSYPYNQERHTELVFLQSPAFQKLVQPFLLKNYSSLSKK